MHISIENIEKSANVGDDVSNRLSSSIFSQRVAVVFASAVLFLLLVALLVPNALAGNTSKEKTLGRLDPLGQKVYELAPLPGAVSPGDLPYSEQALIITRDGQRNARVKAEQEAWERHAELAAAQRDAREAERQAQADNETESLEPVFDVVDEFEETVPELSSYESGKTSTVDYSAMAKSAQQEWLDEQKSMGQQAESLTDSTQRDASVALPPIQNSSAEFRRLEAQREQEEEARKKEREQANYRWSLEHPENGAHRKALAIAGELVPWVYERNGCPDDTAGMWRGTGAVDDGRGSYIVGHNPGVFHKLIDENMGLGDVISVWDTDCNAKAYVIDDVFIIDQGSLYNKDLRRRTTESGGECIALQTCIDNGKRYKVFVAH